MIDMLEQFRRQDRMGIPRFYCPRPIDVLFDGAKGRAFPRWMEVALVVGVLLAITACGYMTANLMAVR